MTNPNALSAKRPATRPISRTLLVLAVTLVGGCDLGSGPPPVPASLEVVAGADQTATVATAVPTPPSVRVLNKKGKPMKGREVVFSVASGGGALTGNVIVTGRDGVARPGTWILGPRSGTQSIQARVPGLPPITITATAEPDVPATVTIQGGNSQVGIVGGTLSARPSVQVRDRYGNATSDVAVSFQVVEGGGFLTETSSTSDANGIAVAGAWTLGTAPGPNALEAMVTGLSPALFTAAALADVPSRITVLVGDDQTGVVGEPLPLKPTLTLADRFGNLLEGVAVRFQIASGGGTIGGDQAITGPGGVAASGTWTLGFQAGEHTLEILVAGLEPVTLTATALPGLPAVATPLTSTDQVGTAGRAVAEPPRVYVEDVHGNPIEGLAVLFQPSAAPDPIGSPGTVAGSPAVTDASGVAAVQAWTLGTVAGEYQVAVQVPGPLEGPTFSVQALPGPAALLERTEGNGQSSLVGSPLAIPLGVRVTDEYGNGVGGSPVTFSVASGGGTLGPGQEPALTGMLSDSTGLAWAIPWTLGPQSGLQEVTASGDGLSPVGFHATGLAGGAFDLELEFLTAVDPALMPAFSAAEARWESIIVGDLPDFPVALPAGGCQPVAEPAGLDDMKVYVAVRTIDGEGGVLGRAGPCYYRTPGPPLPLTGTMELDADDLTQLLANGMLEDVIIHEMGHILGFGTVWNTGENEFLVGRWSTDPHFIGVGAVTAFDAAGGEARTRSKVPVENTGGPGTRDGHWRETVHDSELMTGWIEGEGAMNPLSAISVASFADLGYAVNMTAADPYSLFSPNASSKWPVGNRAVRGPRIFIEELPPPTPIPAPPRRR